MVSLFLARNDKYLIMFKDSNVFEFTNFSFQTKYNTVVLQFLLFLLFSSVSSVNLLSRRKQEKNF